MASERMQRRIERLLDQADDAVDADDWLLVASRARAVLAIDAGNEDATAFLQMAVANGVPAEASPSSREPFTASVSADPPARSVVEAAEVVERLESDVGASGVTPPASDEPESFAGGRYRVLRFLGEGGKKRVFLAHDGLLDRDVAFSLIKTEGLDDVGRERITREARAMGRLTHQHIVSVYDIGEHTAPDGTRQPFLVQELMSGGDAEDLLTDAGGPLPLAQTLEIALATARGLEFAHAQGVVHRDLKPGNVWLTADGVAKIGDLGLAVTLGETRLTEHGMMVGTYGYMPPEQALGDEITPQADLYSLGAMLYEFVTGRTPFQGDTPTVVISQHLNTQPVAPSWHSDHCPPDLERLILQLLAKAPADRPASATEVITVLESVDPEGVSASHSDSGANPLDRLARGVFVGRQRELDQLRTAFDGALEGRGSVAMLVGEPGIGKTRTVQELETYARMRGANVYWGRTHESAGMPAYWPWLQVGRAWGAQQDFSVAATVAAIANPELLRLFPELRQAIPSLPEPQQRNDSEAAQFLMFDAYTQFVRAQSSDRPWVIVLDDLHWADKPTLQLLQYMARELANMKLLVVGTYRDTDLVRTHPLSEALAELNRGEGFLRIVLKGLSAEEVAAYVSQLAGEAPPSSLAKRIYEETEGNPFFLSEIVNLMTQEGTLDAGTAEDFVLPDGVREALGRRLDRLSEEANELLQIAAVVGREFAYDTLRMLERGDDESQLRQIEEAVEARVIEESDRAGRYRFTHALMQETLLDELSTTRRVRLHGEIGIALERRWSSRADENATLLAQHFAESATLTNEHGERAIHYLTLAARNAEAAAGWDAAAQSWDRLIQLLEDSESDPRLREAMVAYGRCMRIGGVPRPGWRRLMQARELYRRADDQIGFGRATLEAIAYLGPVERKVELCQEAVELVSGRDDQLESQLIARLLAMNGSRSLMGSPEFDAMAERCRVLLSRSPDQLAAANLAFAVAKYAGASDQAVEMLLEAQSMLHDAGDYETAAFAYLQAVNRRAGIGELDRAIRTGQEALRYAREVRSIAPERGILKWLLSMASLRGDRESFERYAAEFESVPGNHLYVKEARVRDLERRGLFDTAISELYDRDDDPQPASIATATASRCRLFFEAGDLQRAREELEAYGPYYPAGLLEFGRAFAALVTPERAREAYDLIRDQPESMFSVPNHHFSYNGINADVTRASLAVRFGDDELARRHAESGIEWARSQGAIGALGECLSLLADIEDRAGNRAAAVRLFDEATDAFGRSGDTHYLSEVISKKEILKA